jgi:hypothetical protein
VREGGTARVRIDSGAGRRDVPLASYLDAVAADQAERDANRWIKSLRHARVGDASFREGFSHRGDSLWWFAELFLHKERVVADVFRTIAAIERLIEHEQPVAIGVAGADRTVAVLAPQIAARRRVRCSATRTRPVSGRRLELLARAAALGGSLAAARVPAARAPARTRQPAVAAFVHSAFWREERSGADQEAYVGPVLRELASRLGPGAFELVGLGPRTNFRARRWWHPIAERAAPFSLVPIEQFGGRRELEPSRRVWQTRGAAARALTSSADLREAASIHGYDAWPLLRNELLGIATLQFPWSARAMDQAGAALDAIGPDVAVSYAEAGGWGRALALEARRRRIPFVGLQHGFIYRHWLNYLHEPDEMLPSPANPGDRGFPRPDLTLVFDEFAARHLRECGRFPRDAVAVTGSPRLDALVAAVGALTPERIAALRRELGVADGGRMLLLATKFTQVRHVYGALVRAAGEAGASLVVKCHPAETPEPYRAAAGGAKLAIAAASADLASLVASADAVVTVNSTVALDAMVVGVPSLVVGLPSNLSPFVDMGVMAGAGAPDEVAPALRAILYDEEHRLRLARASRAFMTKYAVGSDGASARRTADAILESIRAGQTGCAS